MTVRKFWIAAFAAGVFSFSIMASANGRAIAGTGANAQTTVEPSGGFGNGIILQAELSKGLDAKKVKPGDAVEAKLTQDVKANGKVLLRHGAKLIGHVIDSQAKTKESAESRLGFVFDKALPKGGEVIAFNGLVEAVAAPLEGGSEVAGDPGSLSSAPAMGGTPFGSGHSMGGPSASAAPAVGSAVNPAGASGAPARNTGVAANGALTPASRGAFGIDGVTLHEATIKGAQGTLLISSSHTVKIEGGTQLVLEVVAPVAAK